MQQPTDKKYDEGFIEILFADIDDTMTTDGLIPAETFTALWEARRTGLRVVPVTGRPAGWCDHIVRMWPVDGVIGENGAFYFRKTEQGIRREHVQTEEQRAANRRKLEQIRREVLAGVPGCGIASDQAWREYDLAVDFCEDVPQLDWEAVQRIVDIFERHGAVAKVSSIHVNGWFGDFDKLSMTRRYIREVDGRDFATHPQYYAFVGDSPNDEPMFAAFAHSFGVANIRTFLDRLTHQPRTIVPSVGGTGFAEVVARIVAARQRRKNGTTSDN